MATVPCALLSPPKCVPRTSFSFPSQSLTECTRHMFTRHVHVFTRDMFLHEQTGFSHFRDSLHGWALSQLSFVYVTTLFIYHCCHSSLLLHRLSVRKDMRHLKSLMFSITYCQTQMSLRQVQLYSNHFAEAPLLRVNCYIHHSCRKTLPLSFKVFIRNVSVVLVWIFIQQEI